MRKQHQFNKSMDLKFIACFGVKATNYNKTGQIANRDNPAELSIPFLYDMADSDFDMETVLAVARQTNNATPLTMNTEATKLDKCQPK